MEPSICPECNQPYTGFPALSRTDNLTSICSPCGVRQGLEALALQLVEQAE